MKDINSYRIDSIEIIDKDSVRVTFKDGTHQVYRVR